jgi:hypothetical protein
VSFGFQLAIMSIIEDIVSHEKLNGSVILLFGYFFIVYTENEPATY